MTQDFPYVGWWCEEHAAMCPGEPQTHAPEPLVNPSGLPGLGNGWSDLGYLDEAPANVTTIQEAINHAVSRMAACSRSAAFFRDADYDITPGMIDNSFVATWRDPEPMRYYSNSWVTTYMAGIAPDLREPLCDLELPGEGQE